MTIISATYFLIFLPLLSALFCQIFPHKKFPQSIVFLQFFAMFFLVGAIFYKVFKVGEISSDFAIFPLSIALEFNINVVSASFLAILIFLKVAILFFYKDEISKFLNEKNRALFYSVNCLNIFAIIGILTTNNLLNLFLFLEIYSISFFAIFSIASDKKISLLSFNQFFLNAASSLILLFCFIIIYLNFGIFEFSTIKENLLLKENSALLKTLALLIFSSFFVRFFPFWLYFQNLKNTNLFAIFFAVHILFIQANLGFFLILKFYYLFFSKISTSLILIFLAIFLSFYSAFRIFISKHLKIISINFCLNNFAFILICLAIKSQIAFGAAFFYWLGFNFLGFSLFIFATFLKRKFNTSLIDRIAVLALSESTIIRALLLQHLYCHH